MDKVQTFGVILIGLSILVPVIYGLYLGLVAIQDALTEIPLFIRIGIALFISGIVVVMISLVRERIIDWKKEKK
jgi:hypothetical protein